MTLKDRIKKLCKENGISVNRLESDCGFGSGYVSKLGKSTPNSQKLQKIADYFGVSLDYLMAGEPNRAVDGSTCLHFVLERDAELRSVLEKYLKLSKAEKKHVMELICLLSQHAKEG